MDETTELLEIPTEEIEITAATPKKENTIISSAKKAINTIKGKDLEARIEEFSAEITMVIEGISNDQERVDKVNKQLFDKIDALSERMSVIEKTIGKKAVGLTLAKQITWIAGIVCGTLLIITLAGILR